MSIHSNVMIFDKLKKKILEFYPMNCLVHSFMAYNIAKVKRSFVLVLCRGEIKTKNKIK